MRTRLPSLITTSFLFASNCSSVRYFSSIRGRAMSQDKLVACSKLPQGAELYLLHDYGKKTSSRPSFSPAAHSDWIAVLANGATNLYFGKAYSRLPRTISEYGIKTVYSLQLPNHGLRESIRDRTLSTEEAIDSVQEVLAHVIKGKKVLFVGFSLGGLSFLRLYQHLKKETAALAGVFLGCGLRLHPASEERYQFFFSKETYLQTGRRDVMAEFHGSRIASEGKEEEWVYTVRNIARWLNRGSSIFLNWEEVKAVLNDGVRFLVGAEEEAWPAEHVSWALERYAEEYNVSTEQIPTKLRILPEVRSHFEYFNEKGGGEHAPWTAVRRELLLALDETVGKATTPTAKL